MSSLMLLLLSQRWKRKICETDALVVEVADGTTIGSLTEEDVMIRGRDEIERLMGCRG